MLIRLSFKGWKKSNLILVASIVSIPWVNENAIMYCYFMDIRKSSFKEKTGFGIDIVSSNINITRKLCNNNQKIQKLTEYMWLGKFLGKSQKT